MKVLNVDDLDSVADRKNYCIMYGDLHFGHLDVRAESLCPHSPHMGTCLSDLKNGTSFDNFSIVVLIDATSASFGI